MSLRIQAEVIALYLRCTELPRMASFSPLSWSVDMRAAVLSDLKQPLQIEQLDDLKPKSGEVVVELQAAALNRRDYWVTQGMYPGIRTPVTLGSDGAGVVASLGDAGSQFEVGQPVIINPGWEWGEKQEAHSEKFHILGMPENGTFATQVVVPACYLHRKPNYLNWHEAAALPLAGVTAYRALFSQGRIASGDRVLITGIGGGVATFALQYAVAAGAEVVVTSSSVAKIERAVRYGAKMGVDYRLTDWPDQIRAEIGEVDLIIDSAGGDGYQQLVDLAAPGARIVNYGATTGPPKKLDIFKVFWKHLHLIGSSMGSPDDFRRMLEFSSENSIKPIVDGVFPLMAVNEALDRMKDNRQFGKIVLEIGDGS
ncbi:MAG: zinc-binding dehydrogenase [Pirellulaceae bacterium]|nr:zinc-binding dehydrogenase [Pirellulaceae bacterium]